MHENGSITLPLNLVRKAPQSVKEWLAHSIFELGSSAPFAPAPADNEDEDEEEKPFDLSQAQANELIAGCGEKTKTVVRAIVSKDESKFYIKVIAREVGFPKLGGVWGGLTKRTKTVAKTEEALIVWEWDDEKQDWIGSLSEASHRSLRKALGLPDLAV